MFSFKARAASGSTSGSVNAPTPPRHPTPILLPVSAAPASNPQGAAPLMGIPMNPAAVAAVNPAMLTIRPSYAPAQQTRRGT